MIHLIIRTSAITILILSIISLAKPGAYPKVADFIITVLLLTASILVLLLEFSPA